MKVNKFMGKMIICAAMILGCTVTVKAQAGVSNPGAKQIAKYAEDYINSSDVIVATAYADSINKNNYIMDTGLNKKTNVMYYNSCTEDVQNKVWCDSKVCYKYDFTAGKWNIFSKNNVEIKYTFGMSVPKLKYIKKMSDGSLNGKKCYRIKAYGYAEYYVSKNDKSLVGIISRHGRKKLIVLFDNSRKVEIPSYVKKCKIVNEPTVNKGDINAYSYRCDKNLMSDVKINNVTELKKVIRSIKNKRNDDNKNYVDEIIRELSLYKASYFKTNDLYIKNYKASSYGLGMYAIQKKLTKSGSNVKLSVMFTEHYEEGILYSPETGNGYENAIAVVETKKGVLKKISDIKISKDKNKYMLPYIK